MKAWKISMPDGWKPSVCLTKEYICPSFENGACSNEDGDCPACEFAGSSVKVCPSCGMGQDGRQYSPCADRTEELVKVLKAFPGLDCDTEDVIKWIWAKDKALADFEKGAS